MKIQGPWTKDKRYKATKAIKIVVLDKIMKQQAMEKTSLAIETQHKATKATGTFQVSFNRTWTFQKKPWKLDER